MQQFLAIIETPEETIPPQSDVIKEKKNALKDENMEKKEVMSMQVPVVKLTRRELYEEIWSISVAGVAKRYDIPYAQMMKQVKEAKIPIPPSGYWTKINFGKPVEKIELDEPFDVEIQLYREVSIRRVEERKTAPRTNEVPAVPAKQMLVDVQVTANEEQKSEQVAVPSGQTEQEKEPETIVRGANTYNVYERSRLHQEVWAEPVSEVAKRYKVSDVAIHKVCKALDVPTPPPGYWAKRRAGKTVSQIPLPPKGDLTTKKIGLQTKSSVPVAEVERALEFLSEEMRTTIALVASQIPLPDEEEKMHTKIVAHRKAIAAWVKQKRGNHSGRIQSVGQAPALAETVAEESIPRACRILDALIKGMEPLGCELTDKLAFVVNGETVSVTLSEGRDKIEHVVTKEENLEILRYEDAKRRSAWASKPQIRKYDKVFNGKLSLTVNYEKTFRDCKSYVLEERLGDIMVEIYIAAEVLRRRRLEREEAERKRQEEVRKREEWKKRYNEEVEKTLALTNLAEDYDTACKIRSYIAAVEATGKGEEMKEWIQWAKDKADWYDPTVAKEDELLGTRDHYKDAESKKLKRTSYWW